MKKIKEEMIEYSDKMVNDTFSSSLDISHNMTFPLLSPHVRKDNNKSFLDTEYMEYPKIDLDRLETMTNSNNEGFFVNRELWAKPNFLDFTIQPSKESEIDPISSVENDFSSIEIVDPLKLPRSYSSYDTDDKSESQVSSNSAYSASGELFTQPIVSKVDFEPSNIKASDRSNSNDGNIPVTCLWKNCNIVLPDAKLLLHHIREDHIGRRHAAEHKYRCEWGDCQHAVAYKRDHLVSHVMVHIPLRNFACSSCEKKFKRSHDLKKHLKIHLNKSLKKRKSNGKHKSQQSFLPQPSSHSKEEFPETIFSDSAPYYAPPTELVERLALQYKQLQHSYFSMLQMQNQLGMQPYSYPHPQEFVGKKNDQIISPNYPGTYPQLSSGEYPNMIFPQNRFPVESTSIGFNNTPVNVNTMAQPIESFMPFRNYPQMTINQNIGLQQTNELQDFSQEQSRFANMNDSIPCSRTSPNKKTFVQQETKQLFQLNSAATLSNFSQAKKYSNNQESKNFPFMDFEKIKLSFTTNPSKSSYDITAEELEIIFDEISTNSDLILYQTLLQYMNLCLKK
ncbi:hypothetical protein QEN19_003886 [Hanseniaspora menglaensis]